MGESLLVQALHSLQAGLIGAVHGSAELVATGGNVVRAVAVGLAQSTEALEEMHS
jgi:hypothetical protein